MTETPVRVTPETAQVTDREKKLVHGHSESIYLVSNHFPDTALHGPPPLSIT